MMMNVWSWVADAALAVLLLATLLMSIRLDRALRVVRRDRAVFETLIGNLGAATGSVKSGIEALRSEADRAAELIERRSAAADKMATDLSFLIEAADRSGARLEASMQARGAAVDAETRADDAVAAKRAAAKQAVPARRRAKAVGVKADEMKAGDTAPGGGRDRGADVAKAATSPLPPSPAPLAPPAPLASTVALPGTEFKADAGGEAVVPGGPEAESLNKLREMAGITTRRRTRRGEAGVIKLVG